MKVISAVLFVALALQATNAFEFSRKLNLNTDAISSGLSFSKFDAASKQQTQLEESIRGLAKSAAKEADKNTKNAQDEAEDQAKKISDPDWLTHKENAVCLKRKAEVDKMKVAEVMKKSGGAYLPLSTKIGYDLLSIVLHGAVLEETDMDKLCPFGHFGPSQSILTGFKNSSFAGLKRVCDCKMADTGLDATCTPNKDESSSHVPLALFVTVRQYSILWTDGENNFLIAACVSNGDVFTTVWFVFSSQKTISDETQTKVLAKVKDYGMDAADVRKLSYEGCPAEL